jgi:hypothetical protein
MASVNIPIISEFDAKGTQKAIKEFQSLEGASAKAQFALKKAAVPAAAAIAAISAAIVPAISAASDLEESMSKVTVIFGEGAKEVQDFSKTAAKAMGQSQASVLAAAGTFGTFGKAAGLGGNDLATFSNKFTTLASDLASFNNTTPEEAINAIGAALRGEAEPMRKFGVLLNDAALKAEAMSLGIYDGNGALTDQQKILAAQSAIYKQTGDAQGDFARTSDGLANSSRVMSAQMKNLQVSIGQALLPAVQAVLPYVQEFATWATDNPKVFLTIAGSIAAIAASIVAVNFAMASNPIALAAAAVVLMAIGFNKLADAMERVNKVGGFAARLIGGLISPAVGITANIFKGFGDLTNLFGSDNKPNPTSQIQIPKMATGGIVTGPTLALIGERGPEAVVPLSGRGGGGMGNYTININGGLGSSAEIGTAVVNAIRAFNRQNGPANIAVA